MSHIFMSYGTKVKSCHTYEWVMSHIWLSHVTHMNESCHIYSCHMARKGGVGPGQLPVASRAWASHGSAPSDQNRAGNDGRGVCVYVNVCVCVFARLEHASHDPALDQNRAGNDGRGVCVCVWECVCESVRVRVGVCECVCFCVCVASAIRWNSWMICHTCEWVTSHTGESYYT